MAEGVVLFGVQKLWKLLSQESERLEGVDEQVDELKRQIRTLQSLLKDADAKKYESERVKIFLEDVKDIVDDAANIIESFLLKEIKEKGITERVKRLSYFLVDRRKFATNIEGITERASKLIAEMQSFGIIQKVDSGRSLSLQERQRAQKETRQTFPESSKKGLVGMEQSVEKLVGHLVENDNIQVVSISGMGGIGKTTLARQRILQDLRPQDEDIMKQMDGHTLQAKLFQLLETSKYLIVLDDIWKNEDWDRIKAVFPQERGWKMILTSRNEAVGLHAHPRFFAFRPRILTAEESWNLCESVVFSRSEKTEFIVDEELEAMGKEMVTYCGGLPLAIEVLGGLLKRKKYTYYEWNRVYENIGTQVVQDSGLDDKVYRVLSLSYEDLSMQLKHCFLYLAHFPEDSKIDLQKLFHCWAAEGITTSVSNESTIQESGEDYLEELISRNMVLAEYGDSYFSGFSNFSGQSWGYCHMHDIMREVCLSKAKEENFLQVIKSTTSSSSINAHTRTRRLVIQGDDALHMLGRKENQKARSLLCFEIEGKLPKQSAQGLQSLQFLRILDLSRAKFEGGILPSSIGELIHLRYLSLYMTMVTHLPSSLRNLKLLLYLNLYTNTVRAHIPNIFKEMVELRYLSLPHSINSKSKLELGNLVNMEYLWNFRTKHGNVTDLLSMTRLRSLFVFLDGQYTSETLPSSLSELQNLETFRLFDWNQSNGKAYHVDFVWDFIHLRYLELKLHMPKFPDQSRFPPHLANISLEGCRMEDDPLPILEKLLHLKSVKLSRSAFVGRRMVCSKGGFPQLCKLEIRMLKELEEWVVEEGSMPCFRTLKIRQCEKLKELPDELKYITSLKELVIEFMNNDWKKELAPSGESYYKVQHIPSVEFRNCDEE